MMESAVKSKRKRVSTGESKEVEGRERERELTLVVERVVPLLHVCRFFAERENVLKKINGESMTRKTGRNEGEKTTNLRQSNGVLLRVSAAKEHERESSSPISFVSTSPPSSPSLKCS